LINHIEKIKTILKKIRYYLGNTINLTL